MFDLASSVDTFEAMAQSGDYSRGRDKVVGGGTELAGIVREGGEAEARRAVGSLPLSQFAINNAFCSCCFPPWRGGLEYG